MKKMLGKKIVVIDDDESIRKTFFLILNKKYRVYLAKDSQEALARFKNGKIDLLIVDLKLPNLNGLEIVSRFRELGYKGEVILISAYSEQVDLEQFSRLAISHFFVKPLDLEALTKSIDYLLQTEKRTEKRI
ncbi:MAG: response regulator [Candidatus Aminicenantales bacterium]